MTTFLDQLGRHVLVLDGGMGTSTHQYELSIDTDYAGCENCTDVLTRTRPEIIDSIHRSFLEAGSDVIETNTFGAARHVLDEFGLAGEAFDLSKSAAEIARAAADAFTTPDKPRFVLGSMGPGTKLITLGQIGWETMLASYREAMRGLVAGGVDAILIETCQDLLQVKCAINAALAALDDQGKSHQDVPIMVSLTIEQNGTMLVGSSLEAALAALRNFPIATLGLNCATGPTEMLESIKYLHRNWDRPLTCFPNAGLPVLQDGQAVYPLAPDPLAHALRSFAADHGVSLVGGCCGTTPDHIRAIAREVEGLRPAHSGTGSWAAASSSLFNAVEHRQETSLLIIGERCNASGSRRFKQLLEADDFDSIVSLARQQVREGSHVLDINVDYAGRDNPADMSEIVSRLSRQVDVPLMIDSTQVGTIEAGLRSAPGKSIINSANFEDGQAKFDQICELAKVHNAALVIGTIDEDPTAPMARTARRKLAIATRAIERATKLHGLDMADLFIDPLVLPVSTGMDSDRRSALELVEATRQISARFPEVQITCGLSNVSFGLKPSARAVLNSVLMHELTAAGMTSAIVHASKILPLNKIESAHRTAALDLIYDRRAEAAGGTGLPEGIDDESHDPLAHFIGLFKSVESVGDAGRSDKILTLEQRLREHIINGEKEGLQASIEEALGKYPPLEIINNHLLEGMKTVGELFGAGEMQLPFVLQSAEVMKSAVKLLEPHMPKAKNGDQTKGAILLATVKGDVHDIGKNLVDIILTNNGYTVHNIGIKQTIDNILAAFDEFQPDAIGLSGLLVKSVNVMEQNIETLNERGTLPPLILGGAALARSYAEGYLREKYRGDLLYGKDAFDGLRIMDHIVQGKLAALTKEIEQRRRKRADATAKAGQAGRTSAHASDRIRAARKDGIDAARSGISRNIELPDAPFFGSRVVDGLDLNEIYPYINPVSLFRVQWQFRKGRQSAEEYNRQIEQKARPIFEELKARCKAERLLDPKVVYGYFPVLSEGNDLIVFDPEDQSREIERFSFPRQSSSRRLCIADFFIDADESRKLGRKDVLGLSCVTVGPKISGVCKTLFEQDDYSAYLYMHGMGVETAEALAELWHKRMRQELGIADDDSPVVAKLFSQHYRGSRYSFGYPACPEMSDQDKLWRLINPTRIGCKLTENWQIVPEQSTSAIVVHHPEAKYFGV